MITKAGHKDYFIIHTIGKLGVNWLNLGEYTLSANDYFSQTIAPYELTEWVE